MHIGRAFGVHSEHDLKEQSDAQIIVSRFPFKGEGSKGSEGKVDGASPRGLWPPDGGGLCSLALRGRRRLRC